MSSCILRTVSAESILCLQHYASQPGGPKGGSADSSISLYGVSPIPSNRSEGFPLTGIFEPWVHWDRGLDTLDASAVVVVLPPLGWRGDL